MIGDEVLIPMIFVIPPQQVFFQNATQTVSSDFNFRNDHQ